MWLEELSENLSFTSEKNDVSPESQGSKLYNLEAVDLQQQFAFSRETVVCEEHCDV